MSDKQEKRKKEESIHIPLRIIRNESEEMTDALQEIFDEDKVVHRQGSSEPEGD